MASTCDSEEKYPLIQSNTDKESKQAYSSIEAGCHSALEKPRKLTRYLVVLCILVIELCERLTYFGITVNMVFYCQNVLKLASPLPSTINLIFQGACYFIPIVGGYVADTMIGRYNTIYGCSLLYILGTILLTTINYNFPADYTMSSSSKEGFFIVSLVLVVLGTGGIKANVSTMGADQVKDRGPEGVQKFFNWFFMFILIGAILAFTVVSYVQQVVSFFYGYLISASTMTLATVLLVIGRKHYKVYPPEGNYLADTFRIIGQGLKHKLRCTKPSGFAHWLDVAKNTNGGTFSDNTVEAVKSVIQLMPIFLTFILYFTVFSQVLTAYVLQASYLNLKVTEDLTLPATLVSTFYVISTMVAIFILDRIVYPGLRRFGFNFSPLRRIAVGFLFMTGSIVLAGIIEIERKHSINSHGTITQDVFGKSVNASTMNVFYQVPQYIFHGTSEALALITGLEFAYSQAPHYMRGVIMGVCMSMTGFGFYLAAALTSIVKHASHGQWYPADLNNGSLEYFMFFLAGLMLVNTTVFMYIAAKYRYVSNQDQLRRREHELTKSTKLTDNQ